MNMHPPFMHSMGAARSNTKHLPPPPKQYFCMHGVHKIRTEPTWKEGFIMMNGCPKLHGSPRPGSLAPGLCTVSTPNSWIEVRLAKKHLPTKSLLVRYVLLFWLGYTPFFPTDLHWSSNTMATKEATSQNKRFHQFYHQWHYHGTRLCCYRSIWDYIIHMDLQQFLYNGSAMGFCHHLVAWIVHCGFWVLLVS